MISGAEILKQIGEGNIVISDFDICRLNPNSYNIRLANKLKVYTKAVATSEELANEISKRMEPYRQEYMEIVMQLQSGEGLEPEVAEKNNARIQEILELQKKVSDEVLREYALDPKKDNETQDIEIPEEGYVLLPGTLYLGSTMEYTETYGFVPNIDGRSTTGRLGIEIHRTAGFGDNGFKGKWTLEITVTHPVIVYPGMEIGQLYYETIDGDTSITYNGKYQNQQDVQAAKVDKEKTICFKDSAGNDVWNTFDQNGNLVHMKLASGYEAWREYNIDGKCVYFKDTDGTEEWIEYDENGNKIHFYDNWGYQKWWEYDNNGKLTCCKDTNGVEYHYDENGNVIEIVDTKGIKEYLKK